MDQKTLEILQNTELEILIAVSKFCEEHGIDYSLGSGTAIGALRHKGFIPWDDDIDIAMTRRNFEKFCEAWKKKPLDGYFCDYWLFTDYIKNNHAKIRKNNTVFLSKGEKETVGHQGIWIDIFPMDKASKDPEKRRKLLYAGKSIILLTRVGDSRQGESVIKQLARLGLRTIPVSVRKKMLHSAYATILQNDQEVTENYEWVSMSCLDSQKIMYPAENQLSYKYLEFCGYQFKAFSGIEKNLTQAYGDYMKLPPEDQRVNTHHPVRIEFE